MRSNQSEQGDDEFDISDNTLDENTAALELRASAPQSNFQFEAMGLKVGDRLQAQPPSKISTERCFVRLIGYMPDLSMMITAPTTVNNARMQLMESDHLVMRVFSNQNAFGFASEVLRVCKLPYSYLHISFPKEIHGTVVRKSARVLTKIFAKVRPERAGDSELTGVISNLSATGAMMDGSRDVAEKGDSIRLSFRLKLHNIEMDMSLNAVVRTIFEDGKLKQSGTSLTHYGMEFVDLQPNDQMLLQSMVYQQMIERPQSLV